MRTPKVKQSILRNPLNELMASEASVRLLRVLISETEEPISAADAASRAELSLPGTTAALRNRAAGTDEPAVAPCESAFWVSMPAGQGRRRFGW